MARRGLGDFEQQVLLTILRLGGEAYSVPMVVEMEERTGREVSQAAVYIALRRMEDKKLVVSRMVEPTASGNAKERRYFKVSPAGLERLEECRRTMDRFWEGLDSRAEGETR